MANIRPGKLVLRCYAHRVGEDAPHTGVCVDLNIAVQADTAEELKSKMNDAIASYIDVVLDSDDKASIPRLLSRRAPMRDWLIYYLIKTIFLIRKFPGNFIFQEAIPFHLPHHC